MKKILSLLLVGVMVFSMIPAAYATNVYENPDENTQMGTDVAYTGSRTTIEDDGSATHDVEYTITVPAKLAPKGSGTVTLEGMWPSDATVKVTADPSVEMVNSINSADKKTLAVTFTPIELAGNNTVAVSDDETVSVADISAALFGTWSGKFNYNVDYVAGSGNTSGGSTGGDSGTTVDPDTGDDSTCPPHSDKDSNETCDICGAARVKFQLGTAANASCYEGDTFGDLAAIEAWEMTVQPDGTITYKNYGTIYYNGNPVSKDDVIMAVAYTFNS